MCCGFIVCPSETTSRERFPCLGFGEPVCACICLRGAVHMGLSSCVPSNTTLKQEETMYYTNKPKSKSPDEWREFVDEDFVAMCTDSDVLLEKIKKLHPFLVKRELWDEMENENSLRQKLTWPHLLEQHLAAVPHKISGKKLAVVVGETTGTQKDVLLHSTMKICPDPHCIAPGVPQ